MSVLNDMQSEIAVDAHFDVMGDTVVYKSVSHQKPRTITAVVTRVGGAILEKTEHEAVEETISVFCRKDATKGIVCPAVGDVLTWERDDWSWQRIVSGDGKTWVLQFVKSKVTHSGHNRPPSL